MRLIHTDTLEIRDKDWLERVEKLGEYAVVSHRWTDDDEEVFQKTEILRQKERDTMLEILGCRKLSCLLIAVLLSSRYIPNIGGLVMRWLGH